MMKKLFLSTTIALLAFTNIAFAEEDLAGSVYAGATFGQFDADGAGDGTSYAIIGGYNSSETYALEAQYLSSKVTHSLNGVNYDSDSTIFNVFGVYRFPFSDYPVYGKLKFGPGYIKAKGDEEFGNVTLGYGAGFGGFVSSHIAVELEYSGNIAINTDIETTDAPMLDKSTNISLGARYVF